MAKRKLKNKNKTNLLLRMSKRQLKRVKNTLSLTQRNFIAKLIEIKKNVCQSLSLVYRRLGLFKKLFVNSNGGTLPILVCNLS